MSNPARPEQPAFHLRFGLHPDHRKRAAELYWAAFGQKLGRVMSPPLKARQFFELVFDINHVVSALDRDGHLIGIAGFKTPKGSFVGGGLAELASIYGWFGALWRGTALSLLERDLESDTLLMDGICVSKDARGTGIGTALLEAICTEAVTRGLSKVRLDVIDRNPRAHALYLRRGFVDTSTSHLGPLSWLFGFKSATTMVRDVTPV